jgi:nucleoside-diphosphate-sugar epimerase
MQTILGSGGAIGVQLAKALTKYTSDIRLVCRNPEKINPGDELMTADLLVPDNLGKAVQGSSVVYVTAGFTYSAKVWKETWPPFISGVIEACKKNHCKLVFFDNIYMYDPDHLEGMTEETPVNPSSKKGKIRAEICRIIMDEVKKGELNALIARSADFYGPGIKNTSMLTEAVFIPLSSGKKASWMGSDNFNHSFTYTPDAGRATALLGNTDDAFNQVWHLPTAENPFTGKEWVETIARELGVKPRHRVISGFMMKVLGLFVPFMSEMSEMMYQYDRNYIFDSSKFQKHFDYEPTPYLKGIQEIVKSDYRNPKEAN